MTPRSRFEIVPPALAPDIHVEDDGSILMISRLPTMRGYTVGARITYESRCSVCDGVFRSGDEIEAQCSTDFDAAVVTHKRCLHQMQG